MKDIVTPVPAEEVRHIIKKCLENAALVNYSRISDYAKIEGINYSLDARVFQMNLFGEWGGGHNERDV